MTPHLTSKIYIFMYISRDSVTMGFYSKTTTQAIQILYIHHHPHQG